MGRGCTRLVRRPCIGRRRRQNGDDSSVAIIGLWRRDLLKAPLKPNVDVWPPTTTAKPSFSRRESVIWSFIRGGRRERARWASGGMQTAARVRLSYGESADCTFIGLLSPAEAAYTSFVRRSKASGRMDEWMNGCMKKRARGKGAQSQGLCVDSSRITGNNSVNVSVTADEHFTCGSSSSVCSSSSSIVAVVLIDLTTALRLQSDIHRAE